MGEEDKSLLCRRDLEEKRQETAELVSKLNAQSIELERLQKAHQEMHSKLAMQELLVQQVVELSGIPCSSAPPAFSLLFPAPVLLTPT